MLAIENPVLLVFPSASLTLIVPVVVSVNVLLSADCRVAPLSKL
jgi:hypothetical protein